MNRYNTQKAAGNTTTQTKIWTKITMMLSKICTKSIKMFDYNLCKNYNNVG